MSINTNAFTNRVEIIFYATLISFMSGLNHIRAHSDPVGNFPFQHTTDENVNSFELANELPRSLLVSGWRTIRQALAPLLIWTTLGFAAGFLIGMIKPG
jgi:hypothetical protein